MVRKKSPQGDKESSSCIAPAKLADISGGEGVSDIETSRETFIHRLEEQLRVTHEQLQAVSEQLETSNEGFMSANEELMSINEEFQSANEELQSTNEELETSKEEMQALNEELITLNSELQGKVEELDQATSNMENLLASSKIATLFLDRELHIRGFTPATAAIFNLIPADIGRSFRHLAGKIDWPTLTRDAETVLAGEPFAELEVSSLDSEHCYLKRIFPYRTQEGTIDGIVVTFIDITKRKRAEVALAESEQRVRRKLESILSPEGDIGNLELADIVDTTALQSLVNDFYELAGMPMSLVDINGKVLVGVGWQDVCTKFHRVHPVTCKNCIESDLQLSAGVPPGEYKIYKCKNNMWDVATPIMVGDRQFGNLFMGQFFFDDEPLDYDLFRAQAREYGFDEKEYIACFEVVPRLSRETLNTSMAFFMKLADIISKQSYSNLKLARSLAERDTLMESLRESEERFRTMFERHKAVMLLIEPESSAIVDANAAAAGFYGFSRNELRAITIYDINQLPPDEMAAKLQEVLREKLSHFKAPHRIASGDIRWVEVYSTPVEAQGKTLLFSIIHDVTDREWAEEQIQRQIEQLRASNEELERFNNASVGRELRMIELKKEVNELLGRVGEQQRYPLEFGEE
jgi:PAS domain S-box-containing protein